MFKHILKKTLIAIATIWLIITISFTLVHTMPGDPIIFLIGEEEYYYLLDNNPAYLEQVTEKFGLNDDLPTQYARYMKSVLTLDFGLSYTNQKPVIENFRSAAYWTLLLSVPTLIISCILGAVLGIHAGIRPGGLFDRIATPFFLFLNTIPSNCLSLLLLIAFAYKLKWVPINGMVSPGLSGAAQDALHPRDQLHNIKRLDKIVIRSGAQTIDAVADRAARRQEDHRRFRRADQIHQFEAIRPRKHDIQKDQIEAHLLQKVCGRQAVIFAGAFVAARAEIQVDQPRDRYFIFHDQNPDHDFSSQKAFPEDSLHLPCIYIVSQERSAYQPCGNFVYFTQI